MLEMTRMDDQEGQEPPRSSPSKVWTILLLSTVLFLSGIGIGWLFTSNPADQISAATTDPGSVATTTPFAESTELKIDGPSTDEPIADVAEALIPSIVRIELPGPVGGVGSGVIYAPDGKILTAAHVVSGTEEVVVQLSNGDRVPGRVLGIDAGNDIAVVEIDRENLPAAPLALDEKPRVGQLAIALGSPWGLDSTVTAGVVSAVDRTIGGDTGPRAMIQTDAPINPGNSGGPLADRYGRVIGINVSIFSTSGANDGVGFAVPIDRAYRVAEALVAGEDFTPGFLGVSIAATETGRAGAVITEIHPDTAASEAGLRVGDVVVEVEGVSIADPADLAAQVRSHEAGDTITLLIDRDGRQLEVEVTLGVR